ncbi:hypothetical protein A2276_01785 [candidate division WOR-1 bacterium RIFOXYA12_FULL_43_27]|uniref:Uncharacterized protein n=1 Tax=candidate division WOR-1 bacterium RIFOXYC2_FULL_46_14 TaxID=1802587 RepID=A0A1F4U6V0_UNCSA|nr:MAG: hypothetical protein A2276_01785 [candidate division WOR-1 bacterium RIFOXYA12_FULL_43_27]OGC19544.1 MAG: hypothetical protein A2292_02545 [candidate division WOR-1 bacterium RIFOXYB2_FULL_46_45]OGC30532.1 MAG: hypothetical protein A2232_02545 [candidate division WOR-1 bacterium RIFOXYA2_FULL_46_56]OGC40599.1 MAG: hypothetical protein A2438_06260 [candidate division WOR-1 bacterium RIFOXYC2_FULL_46_14]
MIKAIAGIHEFKRAFPQVYYVRRAWRDIHNPPKVRAELIINDPKKSDSLLLRLEIVEWRGERMGETPCRIFFGSLSIRPEEVFVDAFFRWRPEGDRTFHRINFSDPGRLFTAAADLLRFLMEGRHPEVFLPQIIEEACGIDIRTEEGILSGRESRPWFYEELPITSLELLSLPDPKNHNFCHVLDIDRTGRQRFLSFLGGIKEEISKLAV